MLYTFVTEKSGATVVEQFHGESVQDALLAWGRGSETAPLFDSERLVGRDGPTRVGKLANVWCFSGVDRREELYLIHIVATASDSAP